MQIELAQYQKIPNKKQKPTDNSGTYASCDEYKKFVERTNKEVEKVLSADLQEEEKAIRKIAPLVQDLNELDYERPAKSKKNKGFITKKEVKYIIKKKHAETVETTLSPRT